jgi:hypothetical protein
MYMPRKSKVLVAIAESELPYREKNDRKRPPKETRGRPILTRRFAIRRPHEMARDRSAGLKVCDHCEDSYTGRPMQF